jgi:hypothetical protein
VALASEPVPFPVPEPFEPSVAVALSPASVAEAFAVASLPPPCRFATIAFNALKSCPRPDVPSHSLELQSLPHVVPFSPPEHCAAAPLAEARRMKSICECSSEAAPAEEEEEVMLAMLEALEATAVIGREVTSWSVLQLCWGPQAISKRVPLVVLARPEAKVEVIAGRREAWREVQRVRVWGWGWVLGVV